MFTILFLVVSILLAGQSSEEEGIQKLSASEIQMIRLAEQLQGGLAKLRNADRSGEQEEMLEACLELAKLFEDQSYYQKALTYLQQGVVLANELGLEEERLDIQARMAKALFEDNQLMEAQEQFLDLFELHQMFRQYNAVINDLEYLGETALRLNNYEDATKYYEMVRDLARVKEDWETTITAANNLGFIAARQNLFKEAVDHFTEAEKIAQQGGRKIPGHVYTNLGIAWHNIGENERSKQVLSKAEATDQKRKSYVQHLISSIYLKDNDIYNALRYNEQAIQSAKGSNDLYTMSDAFETASDIYQQLFEFDKALDYYKQHLSLKDSLLRVEKQASAKQQAVHTFLDEKENEYRQKLIENELRQANQNQLELSNQALRLEAEKRKLEQDRQNKEMALLRQEQEVKEANLRATQLEADRTKQALQLATQQLLAEKQSKEISTLNQQRRMDSLESSRQAAAQQQQIALLEREQEVARLKTEQQEAFRRSVYWLGALLGLILLLITGSWLYGRHLNKQLAVQNKKIEAQKSEIDVERDRAENLLLNILPGSVAHELKTKGVATPQHYDSVSVLFTDFVGFTKIASNLPPDQVVAELNSCFLAFDEIADKYRLEKIKTMGDSYMCAGGIPEKNATHPVDAVSASLEMMQFIDQRNSELKQQGRPEWPIRIGIHTGEVVAGVVGSKKFAYDIWGDTVNVASRMESNAIPGQVNISEATYKQVKDVFSCIYRGDLDVKNKGKMGMYFVDE